MEQRNAKEVLSPGPQAPSQARQLVRRALDSWERPELTERAVLAVSELVTNAFLYGKGEIEVELTLASTFRVEVRDKGFGIPAQRNYSPTSMTGRGLHLVGHMADRWGSDPQDDGKVVWFEIDTHAGEQPAEGGGLRLELKGLGSPPVRRGSQGSEPRARAGGGGRRGAAA